MDFITQKRSMLLSIKGLRDGSKELLGFLQATLKKMTLMEKKLSAIRAVLSYNLVINIHSYDTTVFNSVGPNKPLTSLIGIQACVLDRLTKNLKLKVFGGSNQ